jgi:hypothetical protein
MALIFIFIFNVILVLGHLFRFVRLSCFKRRIGTTKHQALFIPLLLLLDNALKDWENMLCLLQVHSIYNQLIYTISHDICIIICCKSRFSAEKHTLIYTKSPFLKNPDARIILSV